ncbi:MAG: TrmH family RNA methyltransferase [bacterium]
MEILEGKQCVLPALLARHRKFKLILLKQGSKAPYIDEIVVAAEAQTIPLKFISSTELDAMTKGRSHGGVAAICSAKPAINMAAIVELVQNTSAPALLLLIEGTEDAQNLGYTLRSAEALGVHAVLLKKHVWNFDEAALSRASSGAFERLPLAQIENLAKELVPLQRLGVGFWGCIGGAKRDIFHADLTQAVLLAIGGERRGLSGAMRALCAGFIRIPMIAGAGSLSLSHAACIVMAEAMRQRLALKQPNPPAEAPSNSA